uniref:Uncharacterized protein n=1 Tax=Caenorhabditis japonica TaxID=281687 RepID=A0A8R1E2G7_CAEJA
MNKEQKSIGVFELLEHLKDSVEQKCEILPLDTPTLHFKDTTTAQGDKNNMSFVELDKGILLPLKAKPHMRQTKTLAALYETDSEDEEILFSIEMMKRLRKKEMATVMNQQNASSSLTAAAAGAVDVETNSEKSAQGTSSCSSSSSKPQPSVSPPLSDR